MDLIIALLSSMGPVSRFILFVALSIVLFLILRAIWIVRQQGRASNEKNAKNIYVVSIDNNGAFGEIPSFAHYESSTAHKGKEKRRYPRYKIECQVEFIKRGRLFKEISKDLSYTGIFLKSKIPDRYSIGDKVMLTYQLPKDAPQKHNGFIVRKDKSGIGIHFVP